METISSLILPIIPCGISPFMIKYSNIYHKEENLVDDKGFMYSNNNTNSINGNMMFCPDCGNQISRQAMQCPHCGHPFKSNMPDDLIYLENRAIRIICIITLVISFFIPGGIIVPIIWGSGFAIYLSGVDQAIYDASYYKTMRNECFTFALVMLVIYLIGFLLLR